MTACQNVLVRNEAWAQEMGMPVITQFHFVLVVVALFMSRMAPQMIFKIFEFSAMCKPLCLLVTD